MESYDSSSPQWQAARAVLLFLRAATADRQQVEGARIGDGDTTSPEQAAEELAGMEKPLRCSAEVVERVLRVTPTLREEAGTAAQPATPNAFRTALPMTTTDDAPEILLLGFGESLVLSRAALLVLERDYSIDAPYSASGNPPSQEQARDGLRWVVEVGPPPTITTDVDDLDLPEDLRSVIEAEFRRVTAAHTGEAEHRGDQGGAREDPAT